ncbi:hypothetical protein M378DRAFT_908291 [Amanita muscaria Koide BX008]|uniref:Uncharacterized protein n=1 Tax=Amanita muscaria (strain Koide BX008) TaxID=946122 RepID=A0A0C2WWS2_AMAMK|nr:hypothetical protein M378DRAFT_908291 [Amanita muscaria Koide BX008]
MRRHYATGPSIECSRDMPAPNQYSMSFSLNAGKPLIVHSYAVYLHTRRCLRQPGAT